MSSTETHKGILVEFPRKENEEDKEYLQRLLKYKNKVFREDAYESLQDYMYEQDLYENVLYYKNTLYLNENHQELDEDVNIFTKTDQGIEYFVSFYNGGTCLSEMLEEGLESFG